MTTNQHQIYVSTGSFEVGNIDDILDLCIDHDIDQIELSSGCEPVTEAQIDKILSFAQKGKHRFLIHNYFPVPRKPFVLNLSANDPVVNQRSLEHCKRAIDLSAKLGANIFSVHSGFCVQATPGSLGKPLTELPRISRQEAYQRLVKNLSFLKKYAHACGIELAVENHVLTSFNLVDGKNKSLLGVTAEDLLAIISSIEGGLKILCDLGHLKVSAATLGLNPLSEIDSLREHIAAFHVSDNDGCIDTHSPVHRGSWFWQIVKEVVAQKPVPIILEVNRLSVAQLHDQIELIKEELYGR